MLIGRVSHLLVGVVFTAFTLNPLWADDTEIFFNTAASSQIQPDHLFVLDDSLSISRFDCEDGSSQTSACNDGIISGSTTRFNPIQDIEVEEEPLTKALRKTVTPGVGIAPSVATMFVPGDNGVAIKQVNTFSYLSSALPK